MAAQPGYISLVKHLPALTSRVVDTNDAGAVAHTTFSGSCATNSRLCVTAGTHNPQGGWTRAMVDYYIGGLTGASATSEARPPCQPHPSAALLTGAPLLPDGFVSTLFSSFVGAVLRRSLTCCGRYRMHFGAMYSQQRSHRDKPMRHVAFLQAMMQTKEVAMEEVEWNLTKRG